MKSEIKTARLLLRPLTVADAVFIQKLLNTPGWIRFIGDRAIHNSDDARSYIIRVNENPFVTYWVVQLQTETTAIGVITFIKREYLDHPDIGFAFLPQFSGQGYAAEAAAAVMTLIKEYPEYTCIYGTTIKENSSSIRLLEKLGLHFEREIEHDGEKLLLYAIVF